MGVFACLVLSFVAGVLAGFCLLAGALLREFTRDLHHIGGPAMAQLKPLVVDISHHNTVKDFAQVFTAGIRGVIHKATQGTRFVDKRYAERRAAARAAGLLWGAYHFATDAPVDDQVAHFLHTVGDDPDCLLALDWEPNPQGGTMTLDQAKLFLRLVYERTGRKPILYSGHLLKEKIGRKGDAALSEYRLWLAQYASRPVLPPSFDSYWLWQYTGDGMGPEPHNVAGIIAGNKGIDLNVFGGQDLAAEWIDTGEPSPVVEDVPDTTPVKSPSQTSAAELRKEGSGTMSALDTALAAVGLPTLAIIFKAICDFFGMFKGTLHALDALIAKHLAEILIAGLVGLVGVCGVLLWGKLRLRLAARQGRYVTQKQARRVA